MITEKQIGMLSHQININRKHNKELWKLFPDQIENGVNRWRQKCELFLKTLDKFTASTVIKLFLDEDVDGAVNQIKHIK